MPIDDDGQFELPLKRNDVVLCIAWNSISTIYNWNKVSQCLACTWKLRLFHFVVILIDSWTIQDSKEKKAFKHFFQLQRRNRSNTMPQPVDKWFGWIFVAGETVSMELIQFQMRIFLSLFLLFSMPPDCRLPTTAGLCEK